MAFYLLHNYMDFIEEDKKQILSNVTGSTMVHITKSGMEEKKEMDQLTLLRILKRTKQLQVY
ncbi:MAG: hypothetical protein L0J75_06020 [Alkalibacterium sp.]|nr:hypothetical protein [Alkalibacterium sp.]